MEMEINKKIQKLQNIIDQSQKIVFFGGAGVSTASGIPDFRSPDGLYHIHYKYPPEYMLSSDCFYALPKEFFKFYNDKILGCLDAQPNYTHIWVTELEKKGKLVSVITQNIDDLHQKAGTKNVRELHGTVIKNHCIRCGKFYGVEDVKGKEIPYCSCGGIIKPDVVLYGESLDDDTVTNAVNDISNADCIIIAGTSLAVYPAAGLVDYFNGKYLIVINMDSTREDERATLVFHEKLNDVLKNIEIR